MAREYRIHAVKEELDDLWERMLILSGDYGLAMQLNVRLFNKGGNMSDMDFNYVTQNVDMHTLESFVEIVRVNSECYNSVLGHTNSGQSFLLVKLDHEMNDLFGNTAKLTGIKKGFIYVVKEIKIVGGKKMYKFCNTDKFFNAKYFKCINNDYKEKLS